MKVTFLSENLLPYISLLTKLVPSHSQIPTLTNILLDANKNGFFLKATDLEMGGEIKIPAKIEEEGSIALPGKEFLETISSLTQDKISIQTEQENVKITGRDTKLVFNGVSAGEFPQLFRGKGKEIARFKREEFVEIFSYLTFSVSFEDTRPQLTGVYVDSREDGVNFVSTDGYRMSIKQEKGVKKIEEGLVVSVSLINELMQLKKDGDIVLFVSPEESQILFEVGEVLLVGRMIEGQFPEYERVLPKEAKTTITLEREPFLKGVRLTSVLARDNSNIATLEVAGDSVKLSTRAQGVGEGETTIDCVKEGEDNKISFNIKYLLDLLKTVSEKEITLKLNSATEPALFEVKEKNYRHVIMPIQVD